MENNISNPQQDTNSYNVQEQEESLFTVQKVFELFILNWKWFLISVIAFLALSVLYIKRTVPTYQVSADFLVKGDDKSKTAATGPQEMFNSIAQYGFISSSEGLDNEIRILQSKVLTKAAIRKLGLYVNVSHRNGLRQKDIYKNPPITVNINNSESLDNLYSSIELSVTKENGKVKVEGEYTMDEDHGGKTYEINLTSKFPVKLSTRVGVMYLNENLHSPAKEGEEYTVVIASPDQLAEAYVKALDVQPMSKTTTIAHLTFLNSDINRARDFLAELLEQYNEQANADKNEIAVKTEQFINERLEKISNELGATDGQLQHFKSNNAIVDFQANSAAALSSQKAMETKLDDATLQIQLLDYLTDYIRDAKNKYQIIPSNIGLTDSPATALIKQYNETATQRNRLLISSNESNPVMKPLTDELDNLIISIRKAIDQAKNTARMQAQNISEQYSKYSGRVGQTPEQERILTQIGRQQEVRSSLYIILLQKREENSLSLSATANKGRMIDDPEIDGKTSPRTAMVLLIGLILGLGLPLGIFMLREMLRYKIEGRDDLQKLTKLPIIADVMLQRSGKNKGDIVVKANHNGTMEEIFRGIRTDINFVLKEGQKVILFTSSIAGEGKTFNAANTAMSFALLKKRVILVGLDIRKPRLGELFGLDNVAEHGITNLLRKENISIDDVKREITPSGLDQHFDILMAGPIPPNPAELLQGNALDQVINLLRSEYDYVILDTAPVGLVTDTIIISRVTDATVYVTRADYTPKSEIRNLNYLVEDNKLHNVNLILNGVDMDKKKYGYKYGYGRYGKYGKYGKRYGYGHSGYHYGYGYGNTN